MLNNWFAFTGKQERNGKYFEKLRKKEYGRLDKKGHVYLDYTGGHLYPKSLIKKHCKFLQKEVYGNPHSVNPASLLSEKFEHEARQKVLNFFNATDYDCIFTLNATGALRIIGECYPFGPDSHFLLTVDNHNSVNGIREYCRNKGGAFTYSRINCEDLSINDVELKMNLAAHPETVNKLFAYPAQSNVSGAQHSLGWVKAAHDENWDVLLDAAAFVPTSKLDLSQIDPDFVSISFYKIFGYPTGIGCLLVKKSKLNKLKKPWFSGGTITLSAVSYCGYFLKKDHGRFEDGTINYLDIPAVSNGLDFISGIGIDIINKRITELNLFVLSELKKLQHSNGEPLIKLYGPSNNEHRGGTFMLNFLDVAGQEFPLHQVEQNANDRLISFRTGCFCNPGIDELNHQINPEQLKTYFVSREHGDYFDFVGFIGKMRGAIRISVGFPTSYADINRFIEFARTFLNRKVPEPGEKNGGAPVIDIPYDDINTMHDISKLN
ncbi:MAG TPA: aminotransferase class V-fold PLP-dependent enzyme [Paludibacter sp.]|nr:aminotransferase class V-fold PLP-dependent enzyme [Paludibacter sp.]